MKRKKYTYCIFYLEKKFWRDLPNQLAEAGYSPKLKAIVPTVTILRKSVRGKMVFEEVPLLFNYGFIKMPTELAFSRHFLNRIKRSIPGIRSWLRDTITLHPRKQKKRIDNAEDFDDFSLVATCSRKQVKDYLRISKENKRYSLDDLVNYKPGDYVHLKGYPYEGMGATVLSINYKEKVITVEVVILHGTMKLTLPFDNVLYSIYQNFDPDVLYASPLDYNPDNITEEQINNTLYRKIY